jgi:hypothetical protein
VGFEPTTSDYYTKSRHIKLTDGSSFSIMGGICPERTLL